MSLQNIFSLVLFVSVVSLIILRPKKLDVAWPAGIGALLAIVFGLISTASIKVVFLDTWDAALTLIALFILAAALDSNKFFDWAALSLAKSSRGSGWRLYLFVIVLTTLTTALLANDGAILMLTPIIIVLLKKIYTNKENWIPHLLVVGFFADAMSGLFIPSNLTNIIIADAYRLSFFGAAVKMFLPMLVVLILASVLFALRFRKYIGLAFNANGLGVSSKSIRDKKVFYAGFIGLGLMIVGYTIGGEFHLPVSLIALPVAVGMLAIVHLKKLTTAQLILKSAPWNILIYAFGMFILTTAAYHTSIISIFTHSLRISSVSRDILNGAVLTGAAAGLLSALVNNLPATLVSIIALRNTGVLAPASHYAIILGVNIGAKLTPFGALSTLLWLGILERYGVKLSWRYYFKENWWITIIVLLAALLTAGLTIK